MADQAGFSLLKTGALQDLLDGICDIDDLKRQYLSNLERESASWQKKIQEILRQNRYTQAELAERCGVTRPAVAKWCKGAIPSGRDTFLRIGFAARYDLEELNRFLTRYGKCPALCARSLEDSVRIFVLNARQLPHTYEECERVEARIMEELARGEPAPSAPAMGTGLLQEELLRLASEDELMRFVRETLPEYRGPFSRFYDKVLEFVAARYPGLVETDGDGAPVRINVDRLVSAGGWSPSLRQCAYGIQRRTWFPRRRKVISLGLHLNMTLDEINGLLQLARMETLCPRDPVESAIIFAVVEAELNDLIPGADWREDLTSTADLERYAQRTALCDYVRKVLLYLELPDADALIQDLLVEW